MDSGQIPYSVLHLGNWVVIDVRWWHCHGLLTAGILHQSCKHSSECISLVTHKLAVKGQMIYTCTQEALLPVILCYVMVFSSLK